jgi:hypothetical protein
MLKYADFDWQSNANRVGFCKFGLYELELLAILLLRARYISTIRNFRYQIKTVRR